MEHLARRIVLGLVIAAQAAFGGAPASAQLFVPPPEKTPAILDGSTVVAATNSERVATTGVATPVVTPQVSPSDSRPDPIRVRVTVDDQNARSGAVTRGRISILGKADGAPFDLLLGIPDGVDYVPGSAPDSLSFGPEGLRFARVLLGPDGTRLMPFSVIVSNTNRAEALALRLSIPARSEGQVFALTNTSIRVPQPVPPVAIPSEGGRVPLHPIRAWIDFPPNVLRAPATLSGTIQIADADLSQAATSDDANDLIEVGDPPLALSLFPELDFSTPVTLTLDLSGLLSLSRLAAGWVPELIYLRPTVMSETARAADGGTEVVTRSVKMAESAGGSFDRASQRLTARLAHFSDYEVGFSLPTGAPEPWKPTLNAGSVSPYRGSVNYGVPIPAASLPDGLGPNLSIRYSSAAGDGGGTDDARIGQGWSMNVPSIRMGVKIEKKGYHDPCPEPYEESTCFASWWEATPDWNYKLSLGGADYNLKPKEGVANEYVTEIYAPLKIVKCSFGVSCGGFNFPDPADVGSYWLVYSPDGNTWVFGIDGPSTRTYDLEPNPRYVGAWMLSRVYSTIRNDAQDGPTASYAYEEGRQRNCGHTQFEGGAAGKEQGCITFSEYNRLKRVDYGYATSNRPNLYSIDFVYGATGWNLWSLTEAIFNANGAKQQRLLIEYSTRPWAPHADRISMQSWNGVDAWVGMPATSFSYVDNGNSHLFSAIDTGYGASEQYGWLSVDHTYDNRTQHASYVQWRRVNDGLGNTSEEFYEYSSPCYAEPGQSCYAGHDGLFPESRGMLAGFGTTTKRARPYGGADLAIVKVTQSHDWRTSGAATEERALDPIDNAKVLSAKQTAFAVLTGTVKGYQADIWWVKPTWTKAYDFGDVGSSPMKQQQFDYDAYGDTTRITENGYDTVQGDERTTWRAYVHNPTNWIIGKLARETLYPDARDTDNDTGRLGRTWLYYDNHPDYTSAPTSGQLTKVAQDSDLTELNPIAQGAAYGGAQQQLNVITDAAGFTSSVTYDGSGLFVTAAVNALGHQTVYSYAGVNETAAQRTEAETASIDACSIVSGGAVFLRCTGSALTTTVSASAGTRRVVIRAYGTPWQGQGPNMQLRLVTGTVVGSWSLIGDGMYRLYAADVTLAAGANTLSVVFTNDANGGGEDRNLIVDWLEVGDPVTTFGALAAVADPNGSVTLFEYDVYGRQIRVAGPPNGGGPTSLSQWSASYAYSTAYSTAAGVPRVQVIERACENDPCATYNHPTVTYYDGLGRPIQTRDEVVDGTQMRVTNVAYDALGRTIAQSAPITQSSPLSYTDYVAPAWNGLTKTTSAYDGLGRVFETRGPDGAAAVAAYAGNVSISIDANGHRRESAADGLGRVRIVTETLGELNAQALEAEATSNHQTGQSIGWGWQSPAPGSGGPKHLTYGPYEAPQSIGPGQVAAFNLSISGTVISPTAVVVTLDVYNATTSKTIARRLVTAQEFPAVQGVATILNLPFDTSGLSGQLLEYRVYWHAATTVIHDRTTILWTSGTPQAMTYTYDLADHLTSVTDTLGNATRMTYDPLGRKVGMSDPDMGAWAYGYNALGQLITQTDALGQTLVFTYDTLGRMTSKGVGGASPSWLASYLYDQGTNGIGRRARMTDTTGYAAWAYDPRGRVVTATKQIAPNPVAYVTLFGYDAANRVIKTTYPGGDVVTNTYDAAGQPFSLYAAGSALVSGASYNALGQPRRIDFGNGVSQRRYYGGLDTTLYNVAYGKMRQLCVAQTSLGECADDAAPGRGGTGTTLFNAVYGWDAVGNITVVGDRTTGYDDTSWYRYDALDRLVEWQQVTSWATNPPTTATLESYAYSPIGNLTGRYGVSATGAITYPAAGSARPHAATATANGNGYSYDANGNMTVRREMSGTQPFTYTQAWTIENRLAAITKTNGAGTNLAATTYTYDGDGTRVRKEDPDGITLYIGATEAIIGAPETVGIEYYDDTQAGTFNFLNYTKTVVSATTGISYAWGGAAPLAGMGDAPWALRWNAWVSVTQAGLYTVTVIADDGVGLSIAGVSVIYSLAIRDTGPLTAGVGVNLTPGNLYQLQVSYLNYTSTNGAGFRLLWTRPDRVTEDIPAAALRARSRRDYYSFGGATVAMKEGVAKDARVLTYLHGDHLGSVSLTTNASGQKVSEKRYKPYGEVRWSSGAGMLTDFTFTGQRAGPAGYVGSLIDYVARSFSPALGRFISADTIVPGAGNSQAYNRYMYVLGNPLGMVDPSGHGACAGKSNDDFWQCRWFTGHGYTYFQGSGWSFQANAQFEDEGIARDVAREGGVTFQGTNGHEQSGVAPGVWSSDEIMASARAVFDLAYKIGGLSELARLFGGRAVSLYRHSNSFAWNGKEIAAMTEGWLPLGRSRVVHFYAGAFTAGDTFLMGTVVHELAHVIDYVSWTPTGDAPSRMLPRGSKISWYASEPSINQPIEYWAESVTQWVYKDWRRGQVNFEELWVNQVVWLDAFLKGRGWR